MLRRLIGKLPGPRACGAGAGSLKRCVAADRVEYCVAPTSERSIEWGERMAKTKLEDLDLLAYSTFRKLAHDESLSEYEKVGFPDSYRKGYGEAIFADIRAKLPNLTQPKQTVLEIGPGCSEVPRLLIELCRQQEHHLILVDAPEMLYQLPDEPFITKVPAYYPNECPQLFAAYAGKIDVVIAYSVLQIAFAEGILYPFIDQTLTLLSEGARWLIGDVPNISMRKRFFSSPDGVRFHQQFMQTSEAPEVVFNVLESGQIDDGVLMGLLLRCRAAGFDSYVVPQPETLPMANRREDILIRKP